MYTYTDEKTLRARVLSAILMQIVKQPSYEVRVTQSVLARATGYSKSTIAMARNELSEAWEVEPGKGRHGSIYRLNVAEPYRTRTVNLHLAREDGWLLPTLRCKE